MLGNRENECLPLLDVYPVLETLEQRLLLTTLYPGDTFCYRNVAGGLNEVKVTGTSGAVELIGYSPSGFVDIPGVFRNGSSHGGGLAARPSSSTPTSRLDQSRQCQRAYPGLRSVDRRHVRL